MKTQVRFPSAILTLGLLLSSPLAAQNPSALDASDGDPESVVVVDSNGNIGLGTETPQAKFHLLTEYGSLIQQPFSIGGANDYFVPNYPSLFIKRGSGTRGASLAIGNSSGRFHLYGNHTIFRIYAPDESSILNLEESGWLGLGVSSPAARLDVGGDIAIHGTPVINSEGRFVGDTTGLTASPTGPASGDLSGNYPSPKIADDTVVKSINGLQDLVTLVSGSENVEISPGPSNSLVLTVDPPTSNFSAGLERLFSIDDFALTFDSQLGRRPLKIEITMAFRPGSFSQVKWVDPDGDGDGFMSMLYTNENGLTQSLVLQDTDMIARFQTGVSTGQDWKVQTFENGLIQISKGTTFGTPNLPTFFEFNWYAD